MDRPATGSIPRPYVLARAARQLEIVNDPGDEWPNPWTERGKEPDCLFLLTSCRGQQTLPDGAEGPLPELLSSPYSASFDRLIPPYLSKLESREGRLKVWDLASRPTNLQDKMISVTSASVFLMCSTNRDPWLFGTAMTSRRSARDAATYSFRATSALFAGCPVVR